MQRCSSPQLLFGVRVVSGSCANPFMGLCSGLVFAGHSAPSLQDTVPINIRWDDLGYVKMLALAHDGDQRWYYYPDCWGQRLQVSQGELRQELGSSLARVGRC